MAKKKATHHQGEKVTNKFHENQARPATATLAMEETAEKMESLKSLNAILLKETVERRQQVDSLLQSKGSLESDLTRSNSEKEALLSELARLSEKAVRVEMERDVVVVFVAQQAELIEKERDDFREEKKLIEMRLQGLEVEIREILREKGDIERVVNEKESEIGLLNSRLNQMAVQIVNEKDFSNGVSRDRDQMRAKLDFQIAEANKLRGKLSEAEKRHNFIQEEVEQLRAEYKVVAEEKEERERRIESVTRDKNQMEKRLEMSKKAIEEIKKEINVIVREKEGINEEKNAEVMKRSELENTVSVLNDMVGKFRNEEERLRHYVAELEMRGVEGLEKEKEMDRRIDELVKEKNESERRLEKLTEEKGSLKKDLNETRKQLGEDEQKMEQIVIEKSQIAEEKLRKENEIIGLEKKVSELRDCISGIEESSKVQKENIKNLESEVNHYRDALQRVTTERDLAKREFNEEKQNGVTLKEKITEMEKNIAGTLKLVEKIKAENSNLTGEKEELESHCSMLKKEIASVENDHAEARKVLDVLQDKVAAADSSSELLLQALKGTAAFVCSKDEKDASADHNLVDKETNGKIEPYIAEIEEIKNAFRRKEEKVEKMERQVLSLQNSVAEAHKKKSFWTVVSSAATLFAAISLAYLARGH